MTQKEIDDFYLECSQSLKERSAAFEREFGLLTSWYYDFAKGVARSPQEGRPAVVAGILTLGTFSKKTETWRWAWANETISAEQRTSLAPIFHFGRKRDFPNLCNPECSATELQAYQLAVFASGLLQARTLLTPDHGHLIIYVAVLCAEIVPKTANQVPEPTSGLAPGRGSS